MTKEFETGKFQDLGKKWQDYSLPNFEKLFKDG